MMDGLLANEYMEHIKAGVVVEEGDVNEYYEQNTDTFRLPERLRVRHIAVENEEEAKEVITMLKEGADFAETAQKKSIDPTSKKGGDLGWIARGMAASEIEEVAFKLKKGEISDIIHTKTGYHIIKVEDHKAPSIASLEDIKFNIKTMLQRKRLQEAMNERIKKLEKEVGVHIFSERLQEPKKDSGAKGNSE